MAQLEPIRHRLEDGLPDILAAYPAEEPFPVQWALLFEVRIIYVHFGLPKFGLSSYYN